MPLEDILSIQQERFDVYRRLERNLSTFKESQLVMCNHSSPSSSSLSTTSTTLHDCSSHENSPVVSKEDVESMDNAFLTFRTQADESVKTFQNLSTRVKDIMKEFGWKDETLEMTHSCDEQEESDKHGCDQKLNDQEDVTARKSSATVEEEDEEEDEALSLLKKLQQLEQSKYTLFVGFHMMLLSTGGMVVSSKDEAHFKKRMKQVDHAIAEIMGELRYAM
eukprot:m.37053 g.37053  ORF g.37053 m.37053 type:complete len:221 (-) comp6716_c1_seq1:265-927(-)